MKELQKAIEDIHKCRVILENTQDIDEIKETVKVLREACRVLKEIRKREGVD